MTLRTDPDATASAPRPSEPSEVPGEVSGPPVYLGLRRTWWVLLCLVLLAAVDAIPAVGPYLSLAVLLWMTTGLAHARPRPPLEPRPARLGRSRRPERRTALSSS